MSDRENTIIALAESMIRKGGYNAFSFREIAKEIGIKSSSVHYHFPTKEDLGARVAASYTQRFMDQLGDIEELLSHNISPIDHYVATFRRAVTEDKKVCLCGILGAEKDILPLKVLEETRNFYHQNMSWLEEAYQAIGSQDAKSQAARCLALMEGAMITAFMLDQPALFDEITKDILS
ncbi:MAG: TetR/AcrR family transcriptional regulator [Alphaproteobacteria bacterium]|nr:TetR/AcrR family transcriptional regulator [Alphaproteobacteria bacterium]